MIVDSHIHIFSPSVCADRSGYLADEQFNRIYASPQAKLIDCNQATEELAGYGREELVGNNFACLPWLDFRQQVRLADLLAQTARGEGMGPVDFTLTRKDGGEVIAEGVMPFG